MTEGTLIGDSVCQSYHPYVQEELKGFANVWVPGGGTSQIVLSHLDEWVISKKADVVHLNADLHVPFPSHPPPKGIRGYPRTPGSSAGSGHTGPAITLRGI